MRRLYRNRVCRPTASVPSPYGTRPTRIDLLELDIDLRLTDLWREAADIAEWNLEVVSAFMRAAYGKGYCDALTEDAPGSLCARARVPRCPRGSAVAAEAPERRGPRRRARRTAAGLHTLRA